MDGNRFWQLNLCYELNGDTAKVIEAKREEEYEIPATVEFEGKKYTVTEIGDKVFYMFTELKWVTLPDSVTKIGNCAFAGCASLEGFHSFWGLKEMGAAAFCGCKSLKASLLTSNMPTVVGPYAFEGTGVTEVGIYPVQQKLGDGVFARCRALKRVVIYEGVTTLPKETFYDCKKLEKVTLPSTLEVIGDSAFYRCPSLDHVVLPTTVRRIGTHGLGDASAEFKEHESEE